MKAPSGSVRPQTDPPLPGFPLPRRHRRMIACAAVAASLLLGGLGVGATAETARHRPPALFTSAATR